MHRITSVVVSCLCLAAPAGLAGGGARADQNLNCDAYAAAAVEYQKLNQTYGCGYSGGAWSTDFGGHRTWCLAPSVTMADLTREHNARGQAIGQCRRRFIACDHYARLAREQNRENLLRRCGFSGGRWSDDVAGHRAWCMNASSEQSLGESSARQGALKSCTDRLANIDLQNATQKQQQLLEMLKNLSKMMHDAQMGIIRKVN